MGCMPIRDRLRLRTYNNLPDSNDQGDSPDQEFIQGSSRDHEQEIPPAEHQIQQSNEDEMEQDHDQIEIDRSPPQTDDEMSSIKASISIYIDYSAHHTSTTLKVLASSCTNMKDDEVVELQHGPNDSASCMNTSKRSVD
ncbi:hypothetical protein WG66_013689 [Moniliophthora roreri]|nr:hypothetical protein WG66_013689 [Moniliophthora roreri]